MYKHCCNLLFSDYLASQSYTLSDGINNLDSKFFENLIKSIANFLSVKHYFELDLQIVDCDEMQSYNNKYRKKNQNTNILAFKEFVHLNFNDLKKNQQTLDNFFDTYKSSTSEKNKVFIGNLLADDKLIKKQAIIFNKNYSEYWSHMFIHSCLHLLGFDHDNVSNQDKMEAVEIELMSQLGFANPYIKD